MLWTCLHLPDFPLQLALRAAATVSVPLVISDGGSRPCVLSCNATAAHRGIHPGMRVSAAWALASDLIEQARDPAAEFQALENLAQWAGQFTPVLSPHPPESLLLETQSCLRLFGGLRELSAHLRTGLEALGYRAILAHAATPTAAWLLARAGIATCIGERHDLRRALAPLPIALLNPPKDVLEKLSYVGVRTLGECLKLPRDGFVRRFGQVLLDTLDRALGKLADPRPPYTPPASYAGRLLLPVPLNDAEPMLFAVKRLVTELAGFLSRQTRGVTRLRLDLQHERDRHDAERCVTSVPLRLSLPTRDPSHLMQLLRERLHATVLTRRTEALTLHVEAMAALPPRNLTLFPDAQARTEERLMLLEHLRARLGAEKVQGVSVFPDHRPEHAFRICEPGKPASTPPSPKHRPLWLLQQPQALTCDATGPRFHGPLTITAGPERIESGWWDGRDVRRDYFTARSSSGQLLWIYRERDAAHRWFVHGLFG